MGRNGRKRGWCGGRRRDWKLRWQNRNIRVVESDDGEVEGDDEEGRGEQEGGGLSRWRVLPWSQPYL